MVRQVAGSIGGRVRRGVEQHERDDREDPLSAEVSSASDSRYRSAVAMSASGVARFVLLDDVPVDAGRTRRLDDRGERQGPLPRRRVVRLGSGRAVLHVEQPDAIGVRADLGHRVAAADRRPVDVQLELDPGRELGAGACPRPSSRRAARTRNRGCDSRAGCRAPRSSRPTRRARRRTARTSSTVGRSASGIHGTITRGQPSSARRSATALASARRRSMPSCEAMGCKPFSSSSRLELAGSRLGQPAELDRSIAGRGNGRERPGQVVRRERAGACRAGARSGRVASRDDRASEA